MKKIGLLILALVVALGGLGAGYAAWQDQVTVSGNVQTGTFEIGIQETSQDDVNGTAKAFYTNEGDQIGNTGYYKVVKVNIENAYPGYTGTLSFNVKNLGSIPAKLLKVDFDSTLDQNVLDNIQLTSVKAAGFPKLPIFGNFTLKELIDGEAGCNWIIGATNEILSWFNGRPYFNPDQEVTFSYDYKFLDGTPEGSEASFTLTFIFEQDPVPVK
jgi:predicted ribosomally synthesized peptide with SipW-like signal peptide